MSGMDIVAELKARPIKLRKAGGGTITKSGRFARAPNSERAVQVSFSGVRQLRKPKATKQVRARGAGASKS